jgi:hypothetical protein
MQHPPVQLVPNLMPNLEIASHQQLNMGDETSLHTGCHDSLAVRDSDLLEHHNHPDSKRIE